MDTLTPIEADSCHQYPLGGVWDRFSLVCCGNTSVTYVYDRHSHERVTEYMSYADARYARYVLQQLHEQKEELA